MPARPQAALSGKPCRSAQGTFSAMVPSRVSSPSGQANRPESVDVHDQPLAEQVRLGPIERPQRATLPRVFMHQVGDAQRAPLFEPRHDETTRLILLGPGWYHGHQITVLTALAS